MSFAGGLREPRVLPELRMLPEAGQPVHRWTDFSWAVRPAPNGQARVLRREWSRGRCPTTD